jgi:hypothetical protein
MQHQIETILAILIALGMALNLILLIPAAILPLFKIDEADRYFGVGRLGGERLALKGLPFSLGRMAHYGLVLMLSNTKRMRKRYGHELDQIEANKPPTRLTQLLVWLYGSWFLIGIGIGALGGIFLILRQ